MLISRSPFLLEGLLMFAAVVFLYWTLRLPPAPTPYQHVSTGEPSILKEIQKTKLDMLGGFVMLFVVATPLIALNLGGAVVPWNHPAVITLFCLTPVLLAGFLYFERYIATSPIFPAHFVTSLPVIHVLVLAAIVVFAFNEVIS
jgi:hypothetical protein